jgi:hypothetical protein
MQEQNAKMQFFKKSYTKVTLRAGPAKEIRIISSLS